MSKATARMSFLQMLRVCECERTNERRMSKRKKNYMQCGIVEMNRNGNVMKGNAFVRSLAMTYTHTHITHITHNNNNKIKYRIPCR